MQKQRPPVRKPLLLISAHFFLQMGQAFKRLIERLVLLGKVDADDVIDVLIEERRAGNAGHADLFRHFEAEIHIGFALAHIWADISQYEIRALRVGKRNADLL